MKGAGEIGFTIVSISFSLIAVFIPLLLMGGIVGRLFREFAMTVTVAVLVSAFVSLTLTPMMCSRFLHHDTRPARLAVPDRSRRFFTGLIAGYRRTLDIALRHQFITLLVFLATVSAHASISTSSSPRASSRRRTTASCSASPRRAQDISFKEMVRRAAAAGRHRRRRIPDTAGYVSLDGRRRSAAQTEQQRARCSSP